MTCKRLLLLFGLLLPLLVATTRLSLARRDSEQTTSHKRTAAPRAPSAATDAPKENPVPFRVGEILNYRVAWASFSTAASLQVSVPERRVFFGSPAWHFRAALHTQSPVRTLFAIDDEFDSYADALALVTRRYETYQNELGRKEDHTLDFIAKGQKPWGTGPEVIVLPGTLDPVNALYSLRAVDWQRTPEFHVPVYDGRDIYQLSAKLDVKSDMVNVAAGVFSASRVGVKLSQNTKQVPDITFEVWLANDAPRTPVQFQARLPFGSIHAELVPGGK
jgi:hypothetical protein